MWCQGHRKKEIVMRTKSKCLSVALLGVAFLSCRIESAYGESVLVDYDPTASTGNTWVYDVELHPDNEVASGASNGFTLYDFQAYNVGSFAALADSATSDWKVTYGSGGIAPPLLPSQDGPTPNLTFIYQGSSPLVADNLDNSSTEILRFSVTSLIGAGIGFDNAEVGQDTVLNPDGTSSGVSALNFDSTFVPLKAGGPQTPLPTTAMGSIGLIGLMGTYRMTRRSKGLATTG
jgi:hypothetical protein